ncbi:hypothetical protein M426DRAFT_261923 [Hypoxylon sp. CI-4A]|nr:hypothetical protein M426DRAFT_261923 [Hypoxylon sp. CI-4A]
MESDNPDIVGCITSSKVCGWCKSFLGSYSTDHSRGYHSSQLYKSHQELKDSHCRICRLISKIKPASLDGKRAHLVSSSASKAMTRNRREDPIYDSYLLSLSLNRWATPGRSGHGLSLSSRHYNFGMQPISQTAVSFSMLQTCLAHCQHNHRSRCTRRKFPPPSMFRVIDCRSPNRNIISAPTTCAYAALSYVWGTITAVSCTHYPPVVDDAVQVALSMGLQFLWVDRYCIDQADSSDKHHQIAQMGRIFSNAVFTIIDASGSDPMHGLPGISRPRRLQGRETIDDVVIVEGFSKFASLAESAWASRGWTFQEGFLSPRRLVFTDHGATYLCDTMCVAEWERIPMSELEGSNYEFEGMAPISLYGNPSTGSVLKTTAQILADYSRRQLSYSSDALNAFLGILQFLEEFDINSIWGLPYHKEGSTGPPNVSDESETGFPTGLPMIYWHREIPTQRRPGFPSWSFLGWQGQINIGHFPGRIKFLLSVGDGHSSDPTMWDPRTAFKGITDETPRYIHLAGYTLNIQLNEIKEKTIPSKLLTGIWYDRPESRTTIYNGIFASLKLTASIRMLVKVHLDRHFLGAQCVTGIILGIKDDDDKIDSPHAWSCILLLEDQGGYYERVGILWWNLLDYLDYNSNDDIAFTTETGEPLEDELSLGYESDFPPTCFMEGGRVIGDPLWFTEAEWKTIIVG